MTIASIKAVPAAFALEKPFRTALGEKSVTRNVLVEVDVGGVKGWGEASGSLAMPEATPERMIMALRGASEIAIGRPIRQWEKIARAIAKAFPKDPTAVSALQCALLDAYCRAQNTSMSDYFGGKNLPVETCYTVSALDERSCQDSVRKLSRRGFRIFKVKVTGRDEDADLKRVMLVHNAQPRARILVDANQGWNKEGAVRFMDQLAKRRLPVTLVEQPLSRKDVRGLAWVRKRSPFPIAADESVRTLSDAKRLAESEAADIFNLKIAKCTLTVALDIAAYARAHGIGLMIGCMMESAAGLSPSVHWACGSGWFSHVDLDSFLLLKGQTTNAGFAHKGPRLRAFKDAEGSGVRMSLNSFL